MNPKVLATVLVLAFIAPSVPAFGTASRPNILYFYVDDMGWGSIGPNGQAQRIANGDPHVLTPNIDLLAAQGINFTRAYGCTVCSPARSSQQTGFHQGHTYADRNDTNNEQKAMRAEDVTMGDALSAAGYVTGYWGKWGYGTSSNQAAPEILNLQTLPTSHGYQHVLAELHHVRAHTFFQPTLWSAPATPGALGGVELIPNTMAAYANNPAYPEKPANQSHANYPATAYCDDFYSFRALDFIRTQAQHYNATDTPFFALLAAQIPHAPYGDLAQLPLWDEAYDANAPFATLSAEAQQWAAMVTRIDAHFGNILAALEDPNNDGDNSDSVVDNTLVIFMSDNGGPGNSASSEINSNGGLRGSKGSIWEGGIRVPMVVRWPAMITATSPLQPGTENDRVIDVSDLLPTFCDLAGTRTPPGLDGISIAPTLTGSGLQRSREFLIHEAQPDRSIIRGNHKLVDNNGALELYNLDADPDESNNIAGSNAPLVTELRALMLGERVAEAQWFANTYHHWTGTDGADTSDAANWSDYNYTNALNSTTYQTDSGAPQLSWAATMENTGGTAATATLGADLELLSIETRGASSTAIQTIDIGDKKLTGRNEIRLAEHSAVLLDNGTLESLRWVDLDENASLTGAGTVDATLYHAGRVAVTWSSDSIAPGDGTELLSNGGFEDGSGNAFNTTDHWTNYGPSQTINARNTSNPHSGSYRGIVGNGSNGLISPATDTGHTILDGDVYTLEFHHAGASGWDLGADDITAVLYYNNGSDQTIHSVTVTPSQNFGTGYDVSSTVISATPGSVGRSLLLRFESATAGAGGEFAAIDGVSLQRSGDPVTIPGNRKLVISGNLHATGSANLDLTLAGTTTPGEDHAQVIVAGDASLAGTLAVTIDPAFTPTHGDSFTILAANSINGTFANANQLVIGSDDTRLNIAYTATTVTLTVDATTAQGTPYSWLESHALVEPGGDHEAADLIDHDHDGTLAWEEYLADTDPNDPTSVFRLSSESTPGNDGLTLRWPSATGRLYRIHQSTTLEYFSPYAGPFPGNPPEDSYLVDPLAGVTEFFRVSVEWE